MSAHRESRTRVSVREVHDLCRLGEQEPGEVRPAAPLHVDSPEAVAVEEHVIAYLPKRAWECYLLDSTVPEDSAAALICQRLQAFVQHDSSQPLTAAKRSLAYLP